MKFRHIAIIPAFTVLVSNFVSAANYQWDSNGSTTGLGGAGTWNLTNAFWDNTATGANDGTEVTTAPTFTSADTAIFGGTAGAVTVGAVTVGGLNFTSSGYTLSTGTITLGANTTILQTTSPSANTTTISSKITGAFKLTLNATSYSQYANLTLSEANDYSGGTDITHNTQLTIGNASALGTGTVTVTSASFFSRLSASGSALSIANNFVLNNDFGLSGSNNLTTSGTLNLGGGAPRSVDVSASRIFRFNGNTSNGALTKTGAGTLTLAGGSNYTGATTIAASGGTLRIRNSSSSSGFLIASGTNLQLNNLSLSSTQNITGAGNVSTDVSVFGDLTLNGTNNNYTGSTTVNISKIIVGATGVINGTSSISVVGSGGAQFENLGSVTTPGSVTVNGSSSASDGLFNNGNTAGTTAGSLTAGSIALQSSFISSATNQAHGGEFNNRLNSTVNLGSGAITVNGQGNTLAGGSASAGSTFSNAGSVTAGSITLNSSSTANTASNKGGTYSQTGGSTTLTGTATLAANGGAGAAGTAGNDAAFNLSGGTFSAGTLAVNSGTVTATGGTLNLGSGGITTSGANIVAINLGAATVGATTDWTSSVAMSLTNSTTGTTFNTTGGNIGLSGGLSGSGKLVKSGTGTLTLSNSNIYSGATDITSGTLAVNGTLANTTTTVTSSRLQGSGSIGGAVTVGANGIITAGNSIESLGVGSLALTGGSTFEQEISNASSTGADLIYSAGDLSLAGSVTLDLLKLGSYSWQVDDKVTLISYLGNLTANSLFSFADGNNGLLADGENFTFDGAQWVFDYDDTLEGSNYTGDAAGTYVTMTVIPEPSAALLGGLGLLALLRRDRRRV